MSLLLLLSMTPQTHRPDDPPCPRDHLPPYQGVTCLPSVPSPGRPSLLQPFTLTTKMRPDPVTQVVGVAGSGLRPAVQSPLQSPGRGGGRGQALQVLARFCLPRRVPCRVPSLTSTLRGTRCGTREGTL